MDLYRAFPMHIASLEDYQVLQVYWFLTAIRLYNARSIIGIGLGVQKCDEVWWHHDGKSTSHS